VSHDDGMGSSTQVLFARHVWELVATSYDARLMSPFVAALALVVPTQYRKPPGEASGSLRASRAGGGGRWSGLTGDEILSTHNYENLFTYH
jgi:hypothetical protein